MPAATAVDRQQHRIPGPAGVLEAITETPVSIPATHTPVAIVCHPHPLHGGTLNNKVVHTLANTLVALGLPVLRFNFRGVGASEGDHDHGAGELDDLLAAAAWQRARHPDAPLWLGGFSFGAGIAARAAGRLAASHLILVAPPVQRPGFPAGPALNTPCLVLQGGADDVVSPEAVSAWVADCRPPPEYHLFPDAGHYFHGHLTALRQRLALAAAPHLAASPSKASG